jgi:hypothetical protein
MKKHVWIFLGMALFVANGCGPKSTAPENPIVIHGAIKDVVYEPARRLVSLYCADCHTIDGNNSAQKDAWGFAIRLDTYAQWTSGSTHLFERLDTAYAATHYPPFAIMPPADFPLHMLPAERDTLLQWLAKGSPNTLTGQ